MCNMTASLQALWITTAQTCQKCSKVWKEKKERVRPVLPDWQCKSWAKYFCWWQMLRKRRTWSQTGSPRGRCPVKNPMWPPRRLLIFYFPAQNSPKWAETDTGSPGRLGRFLLSIFSGWSWIHLQWLKGLYRHINWMQTSCKMSPTRF